MPSSVLCACLLLFAPGVRAQEPATREEAVEHFDRGVELVSEEAYAQAAAEFERAYELSHMPAVLYNLGMAYAAAQRPVEATSALEHYVQLAADSMPQDERTRIDAELQRQRQRIGLVELVVQPDGALVTIDGRDVGSTPLREPVRLGVGEHRVEASRADYERAERALTVAGGQHQRIQIALRRLSASKPPSVARLPIRCSVPDFNVFIDAAPAVQTSSLGPAITTAGPHVVRFRRAGFADSAFRVNLAAGVATPIDCALRVLPQVPTAVAAKLELRVSGAHTALLNGAPVPADGVVPIGRHRLEVSGSNFEPFTQELVLAPGETRRLDLRLTADTSEPGTTSANLAAQRSLAYVIGVGGIGLEIAALAVYFAAEGKYGSWNREDKALMEDAVGRTDSSSDKLDQRQRENNALLRSIWNMDTTAGALAIGGGSLLLIGGIVLWTAGSEKKSEAPRLQVGLRGTGLDVRSAL